MRIFEKIRATDFSQGGFTPPFSKSQSENALDACTCLSGTNIAIIQSIVRMNFHS